MGISPRLLGDGEYVVASTRTHVKALLRPILVFILICGVTGFVIPWVPSDLVVLAWVVLLVGAAAVAYWVVWPLLNWLSASYTVTNRRLITRHGVLTRVGHDIPLYRINDVFYEHGLIDRVLGCGTLIVAAASERGEVVLPDVPSVEQLHLSISELLHSRRPDQYDDRYDDGHDDGYDDGDDSWDEPYEPEARRRR
ncbi:MAG TPA: PH domain-containing protein [Nocardioidaceae bacterium]|nr:PH domain-containing protein [Nocardioidaceae bacterium]